jgi:hypothetical protein
MDETSAEAVAQLSGCAVDRWVAEATLLLRAEGRAYGGVTVRLNARHQLVLNLDGPGSPSIAAAPPRGCTREWPVLPDAATWVLPDLELLHAGLTKADQLHPLVASALLPDHRPTDTSLSPDSSGNSRLVECRGATHRIGLVNGVLVPLDHSPDEIRREELLVALGGSGLPCLRAIDEAHRHPESLEDVRARLDHGDTAGALAAVEGLLGPDVLLRSGPLREELETAARRQLAHRLFRAGLVGLGPASDARHTRRRNVRAHSHHPMFR